jgi:hypothetical protein
VDYSSISSSIAEDEVRLASRAPDRLRLEPPREEDPLRLLALRWLPLRPLARRALLLLEPELRLRDPFDCDDLAIVFPVVDPED